MPSESELSRRSFLRSTALLGASFATARGIGSVWAAPLNGLKKNGPYGPLLPPDRHGIQLPLGFRSRVVAISGIVVADSQYQWHLAPDGGHSFTAPKGGWVYVSNSEVAEGQGGVGALRFDRTGNLIDGYPILSGTNRNCAGGPTPWNTWLSCEEIELGHVWECQPLKPGQGIERPALGSFRHEAAAIDRQTGFVYLTEDDPRGRLYQFRPSRKGNLKTGSLFAAAVVDGGLSWLPASTTEPDRQPQTASFNGGEGIWVEDTSMFFTSKGDKSVWKVLLREQTITRIYSGDDTPNAALNAVDNITVHKPTGHLFVAEDGGNMELCLVRERTNKKAVEVSAFLRFTGQDGSEVTGPAFSPDHSRLYLNSQRGFDGKTGITYEIRGPFHRR